MAKGGMPVGYGALSDVIGGVSRQPHHIRYANQVQECTNWFLNIVDLCARRAPLVADFEYAGFDFGAAVGKPFSHTYRRDAAEAYDIIFNGVGNIQVFNKVTGAPCTVHMLAGDNYHLAAQARTAFSGYTYKDTSWFTNRTVAPAMSAAVTDTPPNQALVHVKDWVNPIVYTLNVKVGASTYSHAFTYTATATVNQVAIDIAAYYTGLAIAGLTVTAVGNVVHFKHLTSAVSVSVTDTRAGTAIFSFMDSVAKTTNLPGYAPNGYIVKVNNATSTNVYDDSYYTFRTDTGATFESGTWVETAGPSVHYELDPEFMPHKLTRIAENEFNWEQVTWGTRAAGDETTNPNPLFIDEPIWSIGQLNQRLVLTSKSGAMLSRVGEENFYEFFNATVTTSLDTDPITLPVPSKQVNQSYWSVPWNGELIIFGDTIDGAVTWQNTLAPSKVSITNPTRYGASSQVHPELSGPNIVYTKGVGEGSYLYRYKLDELTSLYKVAEVVNLHASGYIPSDITQIVSNEEGLVVMLSDGERSSLYLFGSYASAGKELQRAVYKWDFGDNISIVNIFMDTGASSGQLRIVYEWVPTGKVYTGTINCVPGAGDTGWGGSFCYRDHRFTEAQMTSITYTALTNTTRVTFPDTFVGESLLEFSEAFGDYPAGYIPTPSNSGVGWQEFKGDLTLAKFYVGETFTSELELSRLYARDINSKSEVWQEVKVGTLLISHHKTATLDTYIKNVYTGEETFCQEFAPEQGSQEYPWDVLPKHEGHKLVGLNIPSNDYRVILRSGSSKGCCISGIAWKGDLSDARL